MTTKHIAKILEGGGLRPLFQPIVSMAGRSIWGYEGLIRGCDPRSSAVIQPRELFEIAAGEEESVTLDAACQAAILQDYAGKSKSNPETRLFINAHAASVMETADPARLADETARYGFRPDDIVIEIDESEVADTGLLSSFIGSHREQGFLIAFDDFGNGGCSMERISQLHPDFVKLDISLIRNIHQETSSQQKFARILAVAHAAGSVIIAEGVETEDEAGETVRLGGDLIQGFYFSRPAVLASFNRYLARRIGALCQCVKTAPPASAGERFPETMRRELPGLLVCPECRNSLKPTAVHEGEGGIETGILRCTGCRSVFPVISGIPVMLTSEEPYSGM